MGFKIVPLLRGFTEIETLFHASQNRNTVICGGYARFCASQNKKPEVARDVDVFPTTEDACEDMKKYLEGEGFEIKHENDMCLTYKQHEDPKWIACPTVQIIKPVVEGKVVTLGDREKILENFDFSIVRASIVSPKEVLVDEDFVEDETKKILHLKNIHCPISSTFRVIKYVKRGYWITPREVLGLFTDWDGRDEAYKLRIIDLFKKSEDFDPEKPDGEKGGLSEEEINELEKLMRID